MEEVKVSPSKNGVFYSSRNEYILANYPGSAHLFMTNSGPYGPYTGPDLVGVQGNVSGRLAGLSIYAALGYAKTSRQSQTFLTFGYSGEISFSPGKLIGGGAGLNVFGGTYNLDGKVDINAFSGYTRAFNANTPWGGGFIGQSANFSPNNYDVMPTGGFTTFGIGPSVGNSVGFDYSKTYFTVPGYPNIKLPNTNN